MGMSSLFHYCRFRNHKHICIPSFVCFSVDVGFVHHITSASAAVVEGLPTLKPKPEWTSQVGDVNFLYRYGSNTNTSNYAALLQACANAKALQQVHAHILTSGLERNVFLESQLVSMYAKSGAIDDACHVFDKMPQRNVVTWTAMIAGYAQNGYANEALTVFEQMQMANVIPNSLTMVSLLPACARLGALQQGKSIHDYVIRSGFELDVFVATALIDMYAKCGSVEIARQLFDKMSRKNVVSWNAMIAGYAQNGHAREALKLFGQMQLTEEKPVSVTVVSALSACAHLGALQQGKLIHAYIIKSGFELNVSVGNSLLALYAKYDRMEDARKWFDTMSERDIVAWNTMLSGYAQNGHANETLTLFHQMQLAGVSPDSITTVSVLPACAELGALQEGMRIHDHIIRNGFESDVSVRTALISMYAKCGSLKVAHQLFDKFSKRDVVLWNTMIAGYAQNGHASEVLTLFDQMRLADVKPDSFTMASVLSACAQSGALQQGELIHDYAIRLGFESDVSVTNSLVVMYAKCGSIEVAQSLFDKMSKRDVVSWNAMIAGYAQNGHAAEALTVFYQMQLAAMPPDLFTVVSVLQACTCSAVLKQGMWIHGHIIRSGFESNVSIGTALIAMYARCGSIEVARQLFDKMSKKDEVSWNAMIAGYSQNGHANEALTLFYQMPLADVKPNTITLVSVLQACAHLGALHEGKRIHCYIIRGGFESDVSVETSLLDMYAKCGSIDIARYVFDKISKRNVVSWTAMIAGYGMHGLGKDALALFCQMQQTGMKPNHITFISVLSACSHAGLVDEGWQYFQCMSQDYCITPRIEHYACMVDLLGRSGHLDEAEDFIRQMALEPAAGVWGALLGACRVHCNVELAERVAECLFKLEPENTGYYILLSNIYAGAGRWNDVAKMRKMMADKIVKKTPGCSFIEINNRVHAFLVGDRSHPQSEKIYATLGTLAEQMKDVGYVPNVNFVLHDVEEEMKESLLSSHSERLAIAFGLINTSPGIPIRITKNLRMCGDCHSATKLISKIVRREIIVRDANRFHHFKEGLCSCGDYW